MGSMRVWSHRYKADLVALSVVSIWGASFTFQKVALEQFNVLTFICLRYLGMLALSWGVLLLHRWKTGESIGIKDGDLPRLALAGVLGYTCYIPLSTVGLSFTTPFSNALLIATAPLFAVVLLRALRLEALGTVQYAGMLVALIGVMAFLLPAVRLRTSLSVVGDLVSLTAALFFAAYSVASKPLLPCYPLPAMMAYTLTIGTVPVVLSASPWIFGQHWSVITSAGWVAFGWAVIVPVYVAWTFWNWTISRMGVARASLFMYLVPVIGGAVSWIFLDEGFGLLKIAGAALVLAGLAVARRSTTPQATALPDRLLPYSTTEGATHQAN
jgi:drug/metabolite transporter (DMT)-like permease